MPPTTFAYKVRDTEGKLLEGTLDAADQRLVANRLRQMGYTPIDIQAKNAGALNKEIHLPGIGNRVKLKELAVFSRQFATLISSGLTLLRSLTILEEQTENKALAQIVADLRAQVERGLSLSQALGAHPKVFNRLFISMVRAGEASGGLDQSLVALATMLEKQAALRGKVKSAMAYPVAVLCLVLLIVTAILLFIVPIFKNVYKSLHGTLPYPTRVLLSVSHVVAGWAGLLLLALLVLGVIGLGRWRRTPQGKAAWDTAVLKLPIFGGLMRRTAISRFCSTLSALLRAGVPVLESLEITRETVNNVVVARGIDTMSDGVRQGEPIAGRLGSQPVFPPMISQMMAVGEETGALDSLLSKAGTFLDEEIERTVESLTSLMEPVMIVILGSAVGSMVICLYLPMFNVARLINAGGS
ncbi:MAG TPA: type II secretion system F family protein [Acidimicrobiales bacterium]|nr:type II secretion system F family protein [Acidimicrobiales bacterium]